jgi:hypothetical protein
MATREHLVELERKFWTGDAGFYRQNLDDTCLIAFTQMSGAFGKNDIAATIKPGDRWRDIDMVVKGVVEPAPGVAILTYKAHATRATGEPYDALVSSGYVQRDKAWKMAFHQQTPLAAPA